MATEKLTPQETYDLDRKHVFHPWSAQANLKPMVVTRAEGTRVWDGDDKSYLDFTGQLVYTNVGHQHPKVVEGIKEQADLLCNISPSAANDKRSELAKLVADLLPEQFNMVFFTNGGTEANEHAVRMAQQATGRRKVLAAYRSYHGATQQSILMTGEARRFKNDRDQSNVVHFFQPFLYRTEFWSTSEEEECERALEHLEHTIQMENPDVFAALILEPVIGSAGIIPPPAGYLKGVAEICKKYGIKFIADEVMAGFGRTGAWFAHQHYDVVPDLVTFAKGVNSGYVPLGGVVLSDDIAKHFEETPYPGGLTYSGHVLACAAGVAAVNAMKDEGVVENALRIGNDVLGPGLQGLADKYDIVGEARGIGAFWALELVKGDGNKEPNADAAAKVGGAAKDAGLLVIISGNRLHICPPCNVSDDEINEALKILDDALAGV